MYVDEPDSQQWRDRLSKHDVFLSSVLAIPEMRSALRQHVSLGLIRPAVAREVWAEFQTKLKAGAMQTMPVSREVVHESVVLLDRLPASIALRALDALHLATCRLAHPNVLATTDRRMLAAARALSIPSLD